MITITYNVFCTEYIINGESHVIYNRYSLYDEIISGFITHNMGDGFNFTSYETPLFFNI